MPGLLAGLAKVEEMTPDDTLKRDFAELRRDTDGKFNDDDLVVILTFSIEDVAGASGANNVPEVLRAVEILGIEQARAWRCATLNEFRKFFGLTRTRPSRISIPTQLFYSSLKFCLITLILWSCTQISSVKMRRNL